MNEAFSADLVQELYVKELKAYKPPPAVRIFFSVVLVQLHSSCSRILVGKRRTCRCRQGFLATGRSKSPHTSRRPCGRADRV